MVQFLTNGLLFFLCTGSPAFCVDSNHWRRFHHKALSLEPGQELFLVERHAGFRRFYPLSISDQSMHGYFQTFDAHLQVDQFLLEFQFKNCRRCHLYSD